MKRVLSIADSIENTIYSVQRCVDTFNDYNVEPVLAVPEFTDGDRSERADIGQVLDYCFKQDVKLNAIFIGMIRDAEAVRNVASKLMEHDHPAVVAEPLVISPDGKILVSRATYDAVVGSLMDNIHFLILNIYEAELFSGIECHGPADARRAAEAVCEKYHCVVFVGGCKKTGGRDLFAMGGKVKWYEGAASGLGASKKLFAAAVACELASEKPIQDAVTSARFYCGITSGTEDHVDHSFEYVTAKPEVSKTEFRPTFTQPAAEKPVAAEQPAIQSPVVQQPASQQPVIQQPAVQQPEVRRSPFAKFEQKAEPKVEPQVEQKIEPKVEPKIEQMAEVKTEDADSHVIAPVSSLVSPAKSIRDAARNLEPMPSRIKFGSGISIPSDGILARELAKSRSLTAVTSGIEAPEDEEEPAKTGDSVIEDMREKLRKLSEM